MSGKPKVGSGETDYEKYIRTSELLGLQKSADALNNGDEILFQIVHQSMELWLKAAVHELGRVARFVDDDELQRAAHHLRRTGEIVRYCSASFPIMLTMPQADYHEIRAGLGRGSGRDSPGFNQVLLNTRETLWPPFERALTRHKTEILEVMKTPHDKANTGLYALLSGLLDVDRSFQELRYIHAQMARSEIGFAVKSLKGIPAQRMMDHVFTPFFPELWKAIEDLTDFTKLSYG